MANATDPAHRWTTDEHGNAVMPEAQAEYLEWLIDPMRVPATELEYAAEHDMDPRTTRRWKKDARFKAEWRAKAEELNVNPERIQAVVDNLYKTAIGNSMGATKAAELYLKYVQLFTPTTKVVVEDKSIDNLSDHDLARMAGWADDEAVNR